MSNMMINMLKYLKNGGCKFLLDHYFGCFFKKNLEVEQLSVHLRNGIGSVSHVALDVQTLNDFIEPYNLPFEFVDGFIEDITISIPWSSVFTDACCVKIHGLNLVIRPKQRPNCDDDCMDESMWSSMTSSIQIAEKCFNSPSASDNSSNPNNAYKVEELANAIDSIINRVKISFTNTIIRLENSSRDSKVGVALEINIKQFKYNNDDTNTEKIDSSGKKAASAYTEKKFAMEGIELFADEFQLLKNATSTKSENEDIDVENERVKLNNNSKIIIGKFVGKQEIRLKMKQKESAAGPKMNIDVAINTFLILLTPRTLKTLCELMYNFQAHEVQNLKVNRTVCNQKPMTTSDFQNVENVFLQNTSPIITDTSKSLQNTTGWSSAGIDDESDDDFFPAKGYEPSMTSSITNSVSSYASNNSNQSISDISSNNKSRSYNRRSDRFNSEFNFCGDVTMFQLKLKFLSIFLLHQDILINNMDSQLPSIDNTEKMKLLSMDFFNRMMSINMNTFFNLNQQSANNDDIISHNHFRLLLSTGIIVGNSKSNNTQSEIDITMSLVNVKLTEVLLKPENEFIDLLHFDNSSSHPNVIMKWKRHNNKKRFSPSTRTDLSTHFGELKSEVDITVIDRLVHILHNLKVFSIKTSNNSAENMEQNINDIQYPLSDINFSWKIMSPCLLLKLRFPIPNFCNDDNSEKDSSTWFKRHLHPEVLCINLLELTIKSDVTGHSGNSQLFDIQCKSLVVSFQEKVTTKAIPIISCGTNEIIEVPFQNTNAGFEWPRAKIRIYPSINYYYELEDIDECCNDINTSMSQSILQTQKLKPSPFSSKMIKRESGTSHCNNSTNYDGEEIILPGNKEEISEFIEHASNNSLFQLELIIPTIVVAMPSKHYYEVLYNRISNDLLLWTPKSTANSINMSNSTNDHNLNSIRSGIFSMCKSSVCPENSDDEDNLLLQSDNISPEIKKNAPQQSKVTISIEVTRGVIDIFPHARDTQGNVIPSKFGEIQLIIQEGNLFFVSGYHGESLLNFLCLQINNLSLYHTDLIPEVVDMTLKPIDAYPSKHVLATVYKSHGGAKMKENISSVGTGRMHSDDMLTLSIKIDGQENRIKNICLANSLNGATIRHRIKQPFSSWLSQTMDFFDVKDYPVSNYQPWKVMVQVHQQLLNCAIDYRPIHLPYKAALLVENFNISSNITTKTSTSIVRFIAEEASLFISNKLSTKRDELTLDLKQDYVCVVHLALFELSLRFTTNAERQPLTDLRASNNIFHVYTCADSASALMELLKYIASDGDLRGGKLTDQSTKRQSVHSDKDLLINIDDDKGSTNFKAPCMGTINNSNLSTEIPLLVDEAMNDTIDVKPVKSVNLQSESEKCELFLFPNEDDTGKSSVSDNYDVSEMSDGSDDNDDEYVMLDADIGSGYIGKSEAPTVRKMTAGIIRIVDNHFTVPVEKFDVLKAPKNYPIPLSKYTLKEMTLVWHLYGGNDFSETIAKDAEEKHEGKRVTISDNKNSSSESLHSFNSSKTVKNDSTETINVMYSKKNSESMPSVNFCSNAPQINFVSCSKFTQGNSNSALKRYENKLSWKTKGGVNRIHNDSMELKLNKLKYQFEIYPKNTKQASRQVFAVQDLEISDHIASSDIKTFLYQYSSSLKPKQSNAHMVVLRSTLIRPELNVSDRLECCLRSSVLPLRLNIDQDSLIFITNFFSEISKNKNDDFLKDVNDTEPPVMNIENINTASDSTIIEEVEPLSASTKTPIFIRSFIFSPEVPIRLDYEGKHVDMSHGPLTGLLIGLAKLNASDLKLKRLCNRHGLLGFDKLISYVITEWLNDIKKNQLSSLLSGVGPMNSVVQLIQGVRDLFWLPIEQYQKDGRIVRGLQRGANSFTTSTAMAALELTTRFIYVIQRIAETAFDLVSPGTSARLTSYERRSVRNRQHKHPTDLREGVNSAIQLVKEGIEETSQNLRKAIVTENETRGPVCAIGTIMREIPTTVLTPFVLVSQASSNILASARGTLQPDAKTEASLKWKTT